MRDSTPTTATGHSQPSDAGRRPRGDRRGCDINRINPVRRLLFRAGVYSIPEPSTYSSVILAKIVIPENLSRGAVAIENDKLKYRRSLIQGFKLNSGVLNFQTSTGPTNRLSEVVSPENEAGLSLQFAPPSVDIRTPTSLILKKRKIIDQNLAFQPGGCEREPAARFRTYTSCCLVQNDVLAHERKTEPVVVSDIIVIEGLAVY